MAETKQKNKQLEVLHTPIFTKNMVAYNAGYRYIVNTGGSRSSKTHSILQLIVVLCLKTPGMKVSIVRQSLPALRLSTMPDLFKILEGWNLYSEELHQKTEHHYKFPNGSMIEFIGVTDGQRIRGAKRDILFCNEANEITHEEFNQLMIRTTKCCFLDRNPSEECWIDDLSGDKKATVIHSTFRDNPYLGKDQIDYIESMINVDTNFYRIYALGLPPDGTLRIYNHFKKYVGIQEPVLDIIYGLDFGMRDPTALVKCYRTKYEWYVEEIAYETGWTSMDLISFLKTTVYDNKTIYCDSSRPDMIEDLRRNGFNAQKSDKEIAAGINSLRSQVINIHNDASNIWKEYYSYYWKQNKYGQEPVDLNNHTLDAIRYAIHSYKQRGQFDPSAFFDKPIRTYIDIPEKQIDGYDPSAFFG